MEPVVDIYVPPRGTDSEEGSRHYCPEARDVEYVDGVNGPLSASFTVLDPVAAAELREDCPVWISDPRDGEVVWTGFVAWDGLRRSPLGDSTTVQCTGTAGGVYSGYWSLPYLVLEGYEWWEREVIKYSSHRNFDTDKGTRPGNPPMDALMFSIEEGKGVHPDMQGRMQYGGHLGTDMWIGSYSGRWDAFGSPSGFWTTLVIGDQFYDHEPIRDLWDAAETFFERTAGVNEGWPMPPTPAESDPSLSLENYLVTVASWEPAAGSPGYTATEDMWMSVRYPNVAGQRVDVFGANVPTPRIWGVYADEIAADLVGRCLGDLVDPHRAEIDTTRTFGIRQADWRDPISPGELLDDLIHFHPDYLWRIGRRSITSGLSPFWWRPWAPTAKYVIDTTTAEIDLSLSPSPLYNQVTVSWTDARGRHRSATFTASPFDYPDIASLQGVREPEPLNLGDSLSNRESIDHIGEMWLSQVAVKHPAGTIRVTGRVLDVTTQTLVPPSQIEAGTTLALSSDQPTRVHRVQEVKHVGVDEATLTIGSPQIDLTRIIESQTRGRR